MQDENELLMDCAVRLALLVTLVKKKGGAVNEIDVLVNKDGTTDDLIQIMQEALDRSTRRGRTVRRRIDAL